MKITLDPGHGERGNPYPAAPGFFEGTQMWKLSNFLTAELVKHGFEVVNTRPRVQDDPTVTARGELAARNGSVMLYSLHSNAPGSPTQTTVTGSEIFISVKGAAHRPLAERLLADIVRVMDHTSRGVKTRALDNDPKRDWLGVLRGASDNGLTCVMLAEFGFHTNPRDAAFLTNDDSLRRLAASQAAILADHFKVKPGTNPAPATTPTPNPPAGGFKQGDIVQFTGGGVFVSSAAATPAHSRGASRCKITQPVVMSRKNPYHLVSEDKGNVHGWVMPVDVRAIAAETPTTPAQPSTPPPAQTSAPAPTTPPQPDTRGLTHIAGQAVATAAQCRAYMRRINPDAPDLADIYIAEGIIEGIRGDIAFAQSCLETGNFRFTGSAVTLAQNNFCGMGVTQNGMTGNSFDTPQQGVRAQIHHLKAYANTEPLVNMPPVSPRFNLVQRGVAPFVEWLGIQENPQGRGWAAGAEYGAKILRILAAIIATDAPPEKTPEEITVDNAVADGLITDRAHWLGVLTGNIKPVPEFIKIVMDRAHEKINK